MSKHRELINKGIELANKGMYDKDARRQLIKAHFIRELPNYKFIGDLYKDLARKYGCAVSHVRFVCK